MHTLLIDRPRANALMSALVGLHDTLTEVLHEAARAGDDEAAEIVELRLALLDDLLTDLSVKFPSANGWRTYYAASVASVTGARQ